MIWSKLKKVIKNPKKIIVYLSSKGIIKYDDKKYLEFVYEEKTGEKLNLENPKTFNEKLQWLKLYNRKPEYSNLVDKYEVRDYVKKTIGKEYLVPCYGVYNNAKEIDFDKLPNKFVLKATHDSGTIVICKDKNSFDKKSAIKKLNKRLKRKYYYLWREWPYKDVKPRITAEKYMEDKTQNGLNDYKFYCFNGEPKMMFIVTDRGGDTRAAFYDMKFNRLKVRQTYPDSEKEMTKPKQFDEMIELCKKLSKGFPHVRVDFYIIDNKIYFGEMTFFDGAGFDTFTPAKYDRILGDWINLDNINK